MLNSFGLSRFYGLVSLACGKLSSFLALSMKETPKGNEIKRLKSCFSDSNIFFNMRLNRVILKSDFPRCTGVRNFDVNRMNATTGNNRKLK